MNLFSKLYYAYLRLRNSLDFAIRQRIHLTTRPFSGTYSAHQDIPASYPSEKREKVKQEIDRLNSKYHFDYFAAGHTPEETRENYFYLAMLDEALERTDCGFTETLTAADIGPSSWFYVHALSAALTWNRSNTPRTVHLTGYEVDAYRLFSDFHTRKDHALGNLRGLPNVEFIDHGFNVQPDKFDVITLFFPFVFEKDHLQWGLPGNLFNPMILMKAVWESVSPNGLMIIVNQGLEENQAERKLVKDLNIPVCAAFRMEPLLYSYPLDRYIITAQK